MICNTSLPTGTQLVIPGLHSPFQILKNTSPNNNFKFPCKRLKDQEKRIRCLAKACYKHGKKKSECGNFTIRYENIALRLV